MTRAAEHPAGEALQRLGVDRFTRHVFLCADQSKAKCCDLGQGQDSWAFLKRRLVELGLESRQAEAALA